MFLWVSASPQGGQQTSKDLQGWCDTLHVRVEGPSDFCLYPAHPSECPESHLPHPWCRAVQFVNACKDMVLCGPSSTTRSLHDHCLVSDAK